VLERLREKSISSQDRNVLSEHHMIGRNAAAETEGDEEEGTMREKQMRENERCRKRETRER
jgi:hypothetical protein